MKLLALLVCVLFTSCQKQENQKQFSPEMEKRLRNLVARDQIIGRINLLFESVDNQNWENVKDVLASEVDFDMGSGGQKKTADEVIAIWKEATAGLQGIHHQAGNYGVYVEGKTAIAKLYGTATHYKKLKSGKNTRTFYGTYEMKIIMPDDTKDDWTGWKISSFVYKNKFMDGNLELK